MIALPTAAKPTAISPIALPTAGRVTFHEYAEKWRAIQVHRPTTQAHTETMLRRHAYPYFGDRPIASILPSDVQAWVKGLSGTLAASTVGVAHGIVSGIFRSAVKDRRLIANPCESTKLPRADIAKVVPLSTESVNLIIESAPARWQAMMTLGAGTGMRNGECLGLTVDRVDFLRRTVTVDQQLVTVARREPFLAPPKTAASVRTIPMPQVVVDALSAHIATHGLGLGGLLFPGDDGQPMRRQVFSGRVWRPTITISKLPKGTVFHDLCHYYASLLILHGESIKTVQARMGHASAVETLDTYSHMFPESEDTTRAAIDDVLGRVADSVRTSSRS